MYRKTGKELCVVVTNVSSGYVEYCHVKTTPYLPVVDAVRMTLATPGATRYLSVAAPEKKRLLTICNEQRLRYNVKLNNVQPKKCI